MGFWRSQAICQKVVLKLSVQKIVWNLSNYMTKSATPTRDQENFVSWLIKSNLSLLGEIMRNVKHGQSIKNRGMGYYQGDFGYQALIWQWWCARHASKVLASHWYKHSNLRRSGWKSNRGPHDVKQPVFCWPKVSSPKDGVFPPSLTPSFPLYLHQWYFWVRYSQDQSE